MLNADSPRDFRGAFFASTAFFAGALVVFFAAAFAGAGAACFAGAFDAVREVDDVLTGSGGSGAARSGRSRRGRTGTSLIDGVVRRRGGRGLPSLPRSAV